MIRRRRKRGARAAAVAAVALSAVLASCSSSSNSKNNPYGLVQPGTLTVITDAPVGTYVFYNAKHQLSGFDIDMLKAIAAKLNLTPKFVLTSNTLLFTEVSAHKGDIGGGDMFGYAPSSSSVNSVIKQRDQLVEFTVPYRQAEDSVTVNTRVAPNVHKISDFSSKDTCGIEPEGPATEVTKEVLGPQGVHYRIFNDFSSIPAAMTGGSVDCWVDSYDTQLPAVKQHPDLKIIQIIPAQDYVAYFLAHGNPKLMSAVNAAMQSLFKDGTYKRLFDQYFPGQRYVDPTGFKTPA